MRSRGGGRRGLRNVAGSILRAVADLVCRIADAVSRSFDGSVAGAAAEASIVVHPSQHRDGHDQRGGGRARGSRAEAPGARRREIVDVGSADNDVAGTVDSHGSLLNARDQGIPGTGRSGSSKARGRYDVEPRGPTCVPGWDGNDVQLSELGDVVGVAS